MFLSPSYCFKKRQVESYKIGEGLLNDFTNFSLKRYDTKAMIYNEILNISFSVSKIELFHYVLLFFKYFYLLIGG